MYIVIDHSNGRVHVMFGDDHQPAQVTHTMEKHGLLLGWDGHGGLLGIEVIAKDGEPISVRETVNGML